MRNVLLTLHAQAAWYGGFYVWAIRAKLVDAEAYVRTYLRVTIARLLNRAVDLLVRAHAWVMTSRNDSFDAPLAQVVEPNFYNEVAQVIEDVLPGAVQEELVYLDGLDASRYEMWDAFIDGGDWDYAEVYDEEPPVFVNVEKLS